VAGLGDRAPVGINAHIPNHARVYDYMLGGKDNYAADREAAARITEVAPDTPLLAVANRRFLVRAVRLIAEAGIRQFVDLGTGIPTSPNIHEVARGVHPDARVAYVDIDPVVVVHNQALLAVDAGVITVQGDVRKPQEILEDPDLRRHIDFTEPVGMLFVAVLHLVTDEEDPADVIAQFRDSLAPGSHVAIVQFTDDSDTEGIKTFNRIYEDSPIKVTFRPRSQITGFFDGFELLSPGVVDVEDWRPDMESPQTSLKIAGGVGRKP
jgi:SAM-dependent methyltransferase